MLDRPTVESWLTTDRGRRALALEDGRVVGYVAVVRLRRLVGPRRRAAAGGRSRAARAGLGPGPGPLGAAAGPRLRAGASSFVEVVADQEGACAMFGALGLPGRGPAARPRARPRRSICATSSCSPTRSPTTGRRWRRRGSTTLWGERGTRRVGRTSYGDLHDPAPHRARRRRRRPRHAPHRRRARTAAAPAARAGGRQAGGQARVAPGQGGAPRRRPRRRAGEDRRRALGRRAPGARPPLQGRGVVVEPRLPAAGAGLPDDGPDGRRPDLRRRPGLAQRAAGPLRRRERARRAGAVQRPADQPGRAEGGDRHRRRELRPRHRQLRARHGAAAADPRDGRHCRRSRWAATSPSPPARSCCGPRCSSSCSTSRRPRACASSRCS